ncbi:MAG: AGE family epimerase/isomerase [Rhizobiaceae bacterium]|nr:AGE family epimerase/isomerase [Rhizobiaceae bacterium]
MSIVVPIHAVDAGSFATSFVPRWLEFARDAVHGGVFDRLDMEGRPVAGDPKTTLVLARVAFTLAHLHLATGDTRLLDAAREVHGFLDRHLRDEDGGYRFSVARDGSRLAGPASRLRRSYDQSFVLLALVTLRKAAPDAVDPARIDDCWRFISTRLTDPSDGSLFEDDVMAAAGARPGDLRAQNPHMHMFEALLQAFEMTGEPVWLDRARPMLELARRHFIDPETGAVREFVGYDLKPFDGVEGERREPGHQYEWAWLLHRFADLSGEEDVRKLALPMTAFAERHGLRSAGAMAGVPFDALGADGWVSEDTHLLWPLTEAGKLSAALYLATGDEAHAVRARDLAAIMFARYFAPAAQSGRPVWFNRLDGEGRPVWAEALSRLLYHVAIFVTEGARAGLWTLANASKPKN